MEQFIKEIQSISSVIILEQMKNKIKDKVTDMSLRWDERMMLYRQIQIINDYISELSVKSH